MSELSEETTMSQAARLQVARVNSCAKRTGNSAGCNGTDAEELNKSSAPVFPLEVFPDAVQKMIRDADELLNYGLEFTSCSLLLAAASAIGNSCVVQMNPDWLEGVTLWMVLVGDPGTGKGHALKRVLKEIDRQDATLYSLWKEDMKIYKRAMAQFRRDRKNELVTDADEPEKPVLKKTILSDVTPEKMARVHADNPRGICLYVDELAGWLQTFNRYSSGNAQKTYNSAWSRSPLIVDRVQSDSIRIEVPSIVVGGTIQPKILPEIMAESRGDDGFSHRLLFCFPHAEAKPWNRKEQHQSMFTGWDIAMKKLMALTYDYEDELKPQVLKFTPEAKELLHNWQEIVAGESNRKRSSYIKGVYAKIEHYAIRFSLIMQLIRYAYGEAGKDRIDIRSVGAAIKLADYFKLSHLQVYEEMHSHTPLDDLSEDKFKIYRDLPDEFKKSEGLAVAAKLCFAERTFERFIANKTYFKKLSQGRYAKQI
jgi:hypothetical protein